MKIAIGADHAGFELKNLVGDLLRKLGHEVRDFGTNSADAVDYPDFARKVAEAVAGKQAERGIVVCGSGVGASVAANKVPGARAGLCHDTYSAHQGVEHDDVNILCLGARIIGSELAFEIVRAFAGAEYSRAERHQRRLDKVLAIEKDYSRSGGK
jgi:ribose 5-phosphate isomerase B